MIKYAVQERYFSEGALIFSEIVLKDMFSHKGFTFSGSFMKICQESTVPASLKSLVSMIPTGVNIENTEAQEFFSQKVQSFPPSLSEFGNLRLPSNKPELLKCMAMQGQG